MQLQVHLHRKSKWSCQEYLVAHLGYRRQAWEGWSIVVHHWSAYQQLPDPIHWWLPVGQRWSWMAFHRCWSRILCCSSADDPCNGRRSTVKKIRNLFHYRLRQDLGYIHDRFWQQQLLDLSWVLQWSDRLEVSWRFFLPSSPWLWLQPASFPVRP